MFSLNPAALLSIQLLVTWQVFAVLETSPDGHLDILVSRGDSVMFTCNISNPNATQIRWTKGRSFLSHSISQNRTFSNVTSHRLSIDLNVPSKLNILDAQQDDTGLYRCTVNGGHGPRYAEWNLTVSEKPEGNGSLRYFLYILTSATGLLLCGITLAVCLCRKFQTPNSRAPNQNPVQDPFARQSGGEEVLSEPQGGTGRRKQRSQYTERLNSIYGLY